MASAATSVSLVPTRAAMARSAARWASAPRWCAARGRPWPGGAPLHAGMAEDRVGQQLPVHVQAEVGVDAPVAAAGHRLQPEVQRPSHGGLRPGPGNVGQLGHPLQDDVPAFSQPLSARRVQRRVRDVRGADRAGQRRRLRQGQPGGGDGEEPLGGGLHPEGPRAEVGDVEVALQDLRLGVLLLHRQRVPQLGDLALDAGRAGLGALGLALGVLDQDVLHQLLGERGPALAHPARLGVGHQGAQGALEVQARVLVEARVLDRHDRLTHDGGDLVEPNDGPVLRVELGEPLAVPVQEHGALGERILPWARRQVGQGPRDIVDGDPHRADQRQRGQGGQQPAEHPAGRQRAQARAGSASHLRVRCHAR